MLVVANAFVEVFQGGFLSIAGIFGQGGFAADAGAQQFLVLVAAFDEEQRVVGEGALHKAAAGAAHIGGVQNGHIAVAAFRGEPLAGQLHVVAADLFAGQTTVRIVGVVKIRVGGGRAQTGAAYIAVIEEAGADALGGESVTNAPGQGGFAARRQPHHSHIEFLHGFSGGQASRLTTDPGRARWSAARQSAGAGLVPAVAKGLF